MNVGRRTLGMAYLNSRIYAVGGYNGNYGMMGNGATYGATGYGNPTQGGMYNNQYNQYNQYQCNQYKQYQCN